MLNFVMDQREHLPEICYAGDNQCERERTRICSRLLLYLRGLEVKAAPSLEIVTETMRLAGADATLEDAFREMHGILRKHGLDMLTPFPLHPTFTSVPPLERGSMVSTGIKGYSLKHWLYGLFSRSNEAR